ncbi:MULTISPECIES: hypothetical protein [unclassified Novosphingobium]|uniref:hypothetical protein n=1 Tax=unclassified Novosphingobium TaxID=2644732 RepID=UPI001357D044|nr:MULTISPECIES: hypothetical protein [unclassified Novosphingobium]
MIGFALLLIATFAALALCMAMLGAVLRAIVRAIAVLVRIAVMLALAGAAALATGLGFAAAGADAGPAALMGLLAFSVAAWLLRPRSRHRSKPRAAEPERDFGLAVAYAGPLENEGDAALGAAWEQLAAMVPAERTASLFEVRAACVQLLSIAGRTAIDLEIVACAVFLRRNLPELAARNAQLWADADAGARRALSQGILDYTARMALYALRETAREAAHDRAVHGDGLAALRNHIAARTGC